MIRTEYIKGNETLLVMVDDHDAELPDANGASLLLIHDVDWNKDLSPWPAKRVFKKGEDFSGKADDTLKIILNAMEQISYEKAVIAGYSLAGLFALYACTKTDCFDACVSASGSLWFPDFISWLKANPVRSRYVYLSLGDQEKNTRNPLMASVEDKTREAFEEIAVYCRADFEMNPGNHFNDPAGRLAKGIRCTLKNTA